MPAPTANESQSDYMSRCVPEVMKEGLTQEQAVGKCEGMFHSARKSFYEVNMNTDLKVAKAFGDVALYVAKAGLPIGTEKTHADGYRYRKVSAKKWQQVRKPNARTPESKRPNAKFGKPQKMTPEAVELHSFADNHQQLYNQMKRPIEINLERKMKNKTYDPDLADKAYFNFAKVATKKYMEENKMDKSPFSANDLFAVARKMRKDFEIEHKAQGQMHGTPEAKPTSTGHTKDEKDFAEQLPEIYNESKPKRAIGEGQPVNLKSGGKGIIQSKNDDGTFNIKVNGKTIKMPPSQFESINPQQPKHAKQEMTQAQHEDAEDEMGGGYGKQDMKKKPAEQKTAPKMSEPQKHNPKELMSNALNHLDAMDKGGYNMGDTHIPAILAEKFDTTPEQAKIIWDKWRGWKQIQQQRKKESEGE